jgi:L-fuconolactonase
MPQDSPLASTGRPRGLTIDAHQHFWRYSAEEYPWIDDYMGALKRDFLPEHLRQEIAQCEIDATIAVQAQQSEDETRWLLEIADSHPFVVGVIGWVDLQADAVRAQLAALAAHPKLLGVRHIVQSEPDDRFLLRPAVCRGIGALTEFDLTYDILIYPRHLPVASELVRRFPEQQFILDHLAKPEIRSGAIDAWARDLRELAAAPNVCCKVSGLVTEAAWATWTPAEIRPYLDVAFDCFGADRLIAGSDWPVCTVAASYSQTMSLLMAYLVERPAAEQEAVLGGNAARLWPKIVGMLKSGGA